MSDTLKLVTTFDGTGNHKDNDISIEKGSETNIAKLWGLYDLPEKQRLYETGVGTRKLTEEEIALVKAGKANKLDFYDSEAMAFGEGAKAKVESMLSKVDAIVKNPTNEDKTISIDVAGFSRGAAEARDFVNELNKKYASQIQSGKIVIENVILIDTVASIGLANDYNEDLNLNLNETSAKNIFQITSSDEDRANFPLESLKDSNGNTLKNVTEISLSGDHSDNGGGHSNSDDTENYYVKKGAFFYETEEQRLSYIDTINKEAIELGLSVEYTEHEINFQGTKTLFYDYAFIETKTIKEGLSSVALDVIYDKLIKNGVALNDFTSSIPQELQAYAEAIKNGETDLSRFDATLNAYVHTSSADNRVGSDFLDWLAHRTETNGERSIYYNDPTSAVTASDPATYNNADNSIVLDGLDLWYDYAKSLVAFEYKAGKYLYNEARDLLNQATSFLFDKVGAEAQAYTNELLDMFGDTSLERFFIFDESDLSEEELEEILNQMSNKKDIIITLEDASAEEKEGYIVFKVKIDKALKEDLILKVKTKDGSAIGGSDYEAQNPGIVTIKAGETQADCRIQIANDGIYEGSEEFMLYAYESNYSGYDLKKITFQDSAIGTITDKPQTNCPKPVSLDFGFSFDTPVVPVVSASSGGYSSTGGSSYHYSGSSGGGSYRPRVYHPHTTTQPVVEQLPNVPVYECHYTLELSSVALISLPTACLPSTPPLVLDLNHDGTTSLSLAASLALFDYDNDGVKEHTAWIQNGDALLVADKNGDGVISDGSELFGDKTLKQDGTLASDGYDALKEYDTNDDGVINSLDNKFDELKLWMDNGDGEVQEGELKSLSEAGITSVSLADEESTFTPIKENGNTITNESNFTTSDTSVGSVKDVWFEYEPINQETYFDMDGDGFAEKMETWMEANQGVLVWDKNGDGKINNGKEILGNHMLLPNGKRIADSFSGLNAFDTNMDGVIDEQDSSGLAIWKDTNKNGQTDEGELLRFGDENSITSIKLNPYQNMLSGYDRNHDMKINSSDAIYNYMYHQENPDGSITLYIPENSDAKNMLGGYSGGESIQTNDGEKQIKEIVFYKGELTLNDTIHGTAQNDKIIGNRRSNYLYGEAGRDIIEGNDGNDTLEGGSGDDLLKGGSGNDIYVFSKGDGIDVIEDNEGTNVLKFKEGISKEDLILKQSGSDLIIGIKEGTKSFLELSDKVVLKDWFHSSDNFSKLIFEDGSESTLLALIDQWKFDTSSLETLLPGSSAGVTVTGLYAFNSNLNLLENKEALITTSNHYYINHDSFGYTGYNYMGSHNWFQNNDIDINGLERGIVTFSDGTIGIIDAVSNGAGASESAYIYYRAYDIPIESLVLDSQMTNDQVLQLNGGLDQLSTTQIVTSANTGDQVSVSFEMNWDGTLGVMPVSFYVYDLYLASNKLGFDTGGHSIYGIDGVEFLMNTTHSITAVFTQGDVLQNKIYIDGVEQTLSLFGDFPNNAGADITKKLNLGQWDINNLANYGFSGTIDNVQLHDRALTQEEVNLIVNKEVISDGLVAYYDFEGDTPYVDKSGNGHTAILRGNPDIIQGDNIQDPAPIVDSNDYENITVDNELWVDNTKTLAESGLTELILQTGYTGAGTGGATAVTTTQGDDFSGTLENIWFQRNTLDTKYTYDGEVSEEVQELPDIGGSGTVRDMQYVMQDNPTLADTVNTYKEQSSEKSFSDLDGEMDGILAQWVQQDNYGSTVQTTPPLVLDLNGNGITSISLESSDAYFDYDGDGRRELTGWVEKDDGLLAIDVNGDGIINDGSELFGTYSKLSDGTFAQDGYEALSMYDTNSDGIIDNKDDNFSELRIWKDANQNGKGEVGELYALSEFGITSLSLPSVDSLFESQDENSNTISNETTFTADSGTGIMRDIWFSYSDKHSIAVSELSDEDEKKLAIVEAFLGKELSLFERANPYIISNVFEQYNALKYDTMAKMFVNELFGEDFPSCQFMYDALNNTLARIASGNSNNTEKELAINLVAAVLKRDTSSALSELDHTYLKNNEITNLLQKRDIEIDFVNEQIVGHVGSHYYGTSNAETFDVSSLESAIVEASSGNDIILGSEGRDRLYGGSGNDIIRGNGGVDILSGRQGNDLLIGGAEQSVYEYYLGDGHDIIYDQGEDSTKTDIIRFAYLEPNDLKIEKSGNDMIIKVKSPDGSFVNPFGSITIKNGYTTGKIEEFYFDSGIYSLDDFMIASSSDTSYFYDKGDTKLTIEDIGGNDKIVFGESVSVSNIKVKQIGDDLVIGLAFEERPFEELPDQLTIKNFFLESNRIESFVFQDGTVLNYETILTIPEEEESDGIIRGDEDDNYLIGDENNNIFNGGAGNDTLEGKSGDDYYIFGKGSGKDIIIDNAGVDSILMGLDITRQDILAKIVGDDIIFALKEEGKSFEELSDSITIKNYNQVGFEVEKIVLDDGTTYAIEDLLNQAPILENETEDFLLQDTRSITQTLNVTDPDGDTLNYTLKTAPLHGELIFNEDGTYTYSATDKFIGIDSAVVSIDDGNGGVVEQALTFDLSVSAPTITTASKTLAEDSILSDALHVSNPVGGILTYEVIEDGDNGSFTLNPDGSYEYIPDINYNGNDAITIKVTNEYGLSTVKTIDLDITSVNDLPELSVDTVNLTLQDIRTIDGQVEVTDPDGDTLSYTLSTSPMHGELIFNEDGTYTYNATDKFIGVDSAVVSIDDGNGGVVVTQTLHFNLLVSSPTLETKSVNLDEDTTLSETLHVNNPIGGEVTYEILTSSENGDFTLNTDGSYSYNPDENYNGSDSVVLKVTNEYGLSTTATLELSITPVNDAPQISEEEQSYLLKNLRVVSSFVEVSDVDGDTLSYSISSQAKHGEVSIDEEGNWIYKADGSYNGSDSAIISIDDGNGGVVTQTLNFEIQGYIYEGEDLVIQDSTHDSLDMSSVSKENIDFKKEANDLLIIVNDAHTITLKDYFLNTDAGVDKLLTKEGEINLTREVINESKYGGYIALDSNDHLISGDKYFNWLIGNRGNDILLGAQGNDFINGNSGDDLIIANEGDDNLRGESGNDTIFAGSGNDSVYAGDGDDSIIAASGNDTIFAGDGNDTINAGSGNDTIYSESGDDIIDAGSGNDSITDSSGSDKYLFNIGDGNDTISDYSSYFNDDDSDAIVFGEGITKENLQILRDNYDLVFKVNEDDSIRIKYWFNQAGRNTIEELRFADGTSLNLEEINAQAITQGDNKSNWLFGLNAFKDNIYGLDGNDYIYSYGNDDFLNGGAGNDFMEGGSGSDTYFFEKGDGKDTINEWNNPNDIDTIQFANDITKEDISFHMQGTNLLIQYSNEDVIKVANAYNKTSPIEKVALSDGNFLNSNDIQMIIQEVNAYVVDNGIDMSSYSQTVNNQELMNIVTNHWKQA